MELEDLRYFIAAYEATELTESAPQALRLDASVRVRRLETLLGSRLFDLRNGRTFPTRAGNELYAHAKQVIGASQSGQTTIPVPPPPARGR
jgi:DNA-binding transcriptional LysR family regulator